MEENNWFKEPQKELFNIEAEAAVLGTIILNNAYLRSVDFLQSRHFYDTAHQRIFEKIKDTISGEGVANNVSLVDFFQSDADLIKLGGKAYISTLLAAASTIISPAMYGKIILSLWQKRELEEFLKGLSYSDSFDAIKSSLDQKIEELDFETESKEKEIHDVILKVLSTEKVDRIKTGWKTIDKMTCGFQLGDVVILGGRPSMGKTTLAISLALTFRKNNRKIFFISLEVSDESIAMKVISNLASATKKDLLENIAGERVSEAQLNTIASELNGKGFYIDDKPKLNESQICSRIKKMVKKNGVNVVFIDHLGLIGFSKQNKSNNKNHEIDAIVREISATAKELGIVVIILSQLSRANEARVNKRPLLSDLRDSGTIEQNADIIMFVHREFYYLEKMRPSGQTEFVEWKQEMVRCENLSELIVAKNRDGETGHIELFFDPKFSRFTEINNF
jgi:replicative DNA helicase